MTENILEIYNLIQEIAWYFGNQDLNAECCGDLSFVEFMALKMAYQKADVSIQEIGNTLNFTKSGATRIVDRLERKGYIARQRSPIDGRVCCVKVTASGEDVLEKIIGRFADYLQELFRDMQPATVSQIKDVLAILVRSIKQKEIIKNRACLLGEDEDELIK